MNWIKIDYGNLNAEKLTPGKYYLIYRDGYYLASYITNGEFMDSEGIKEYPDFYCELTKPIK